jgi:DNA-binding transcriptional ArsR family regulator
VLVPSPLGDGSSPAAGAGASVTVVSEARRPATPAEAKALAHPVRQRIIRLCSLGERTNQQLAAELGRDPATILYHVRKLVDAGFLVVGEVRAGPSGALEKPYRSTGRSWQMDVPPEQSGEASFAMLDAVREELVDAGPDALVTSSRFVVRVPEDELQAWLTEVQAGIDALVGRSGELARVGDAPPAFAAVFLVHRLPDGAPTA